jgi:hypothetical protein
MLIEILDSLRKTFQHRLNGVSGCCFEVTDGTTVLVRLIPKVPKPVDMTQWRPIALSSCVQKLYCANLISLLGELSGPLYREACSFRKGHQVAEITEALRIGLEKSKLYGQELTIIQADVLKAFDHMSHDEIRRSLEYYGVSPSGFSTLCSWNWLELLCSLFLNMLRLLVLFCFLQLENKGALKRRFCGSYFGFPPCRGC